MHERHIPYLDKTDDSIRIFYQPYNLVSRFRHPKEGIVGGEC